MNTIQYIAMFVLGVMVGAIFFGGLWVTVRRLPHAKHPTTLLIASLLVRGTVVAVAVWLVAGGGIRSVISVLAGILASRFAIVNRTRCRTSTTTVQQAPSITTREAV